MRILRNGYTVKPAGGSSAWTDGSAASTLLLGEFFGPPAVSATVTATEAADTLTATANLALKGSTTATEAADTLTATATLTGGAGAISGSVTATEAADTLSATATITQPSEDAIVGGGGGGIFSGYSRRRRKNTEERDYHALDRAIEAAIDAGKPKPVPVESVPEPSPEPPAPVVELPALPPFRPSAIDFTASAEALAAARQSATDLMQSVQAQEEDDLDMLFMIALAA